MRQEEETAKGILEAPYARVVIPDPATGTFTVRIAEFPGCIAQGDSLEEAFGNLHEAAKAWIQTALDLGQEVPAPLEEQTYSGRVLVRFPASIHRRASEMAGRENTSLNQFIVSVVSEKVGARDATERLLELLDQRLAEAKSESNARISARSPRRETRSRQPASQSR